MGLEPTTPTVTGWCSNQLSYEALERMTGIEPAPLTWKDRALPLCNIRNADHPGFEPGTLELTALCSAVELMVNMYLVYTTFFYLSSTNYDYNRLVVLQCHLRQSIYLSEPQ